MTQQYNCKEKLEADHSYDLKGQDVYRMYFRLLVILTGILIIYRWHYHHVVTNTGLGEHWLFV